MIKIFLENFYSVRKVNFSISNNIHIYLGNFHAVLVQ